MDRVTHFEVPANNIERAQKFYNEIFGWKFSDAGLAGWDYSMIQTGPSDEKNMLKELGVINGGMSKKASAREQQTIVIQVDSIDDRLKKIIEMGGNIVAPKKEVGKMGFYAQFVDTEGNLIGLWQDNKEGKKGF